jgi:hypothetical protein
MRKIFLTLSLLTFVSCDGGRSRGPGGGGNGDGGNGGNGGCMGQACFQMDCGSGKPRTSVSGRVTAPNGLDPIFDASVYVPYAIPEFPTAVQCETCNEPIGGTPIVTTQTKIDGTFTLENVPVTSQVPIVVQKGRFRRVTYLTPTACADNKLTVDQARLPSKKSEGTLPRMAVGVGDYDQIECVLRSFGIDDSEFTGPSGNGSVHLYDNGLGGLGGTGSEFGDLLGNAAKMNEYNLMFINCTANQWNTLPNKTLATMNLHNYVNSGGRLYTTDWSYDYMEQVNEFAGYIFYEGGGTTTAPQPPHAAAKATDTNDFKATVMDPNLAEWLKQTNVAISATNQVTIQDLLANWVLMKSTAADASFPSQTWVKGVTNGADRPLTVTFDYHSCGKVLYSSYHTREPGGASGGFGLNAFPGYCVSSPTTMIAQEKILMYLILQISSCVGPIG